MTASAGAWYRVGTVNVVGGSQSVVGVDTNWQNDVIAIAIGDAFTVDAKTWYEVIAVNSDTSITLDRGFEGSTGTDKSYAILRNTSGTILTRIAGQVSVQFNQKQLFLDELRTWLNSDNATEELTDSHGLKQSLKTPSQMVRDHDSKLAELDAIHPYPYAMRKVEFEALRSANNEKFAASGFVHFGKINSGWQEVSEGLGTVISVPNQIRIGRSATTGKVGNSKTDHPVVNISGVVSHLKKIGENNDDNCLIKLPPAEDGTRTYDSATGVSVTHSTPAIAFASETDTNKVVTDRVDMWGFEAFLREIHDGDPFVYKNGLIQSRSADIDGVTTVTDNIRPNVYFAWYQGDIESTGKGVNWQTATEAQRMAIASNPENNIYFDDSTGKFYQWCIRGRSFAGAGDGDWDADGNSLNSLSTAPLRFNTALGRIAIQGNKSSTPAYTIGGANCFANNPTWGSLSGKFYTGVYSTRDSYNNNTVAVNGECYFLVCGTVNRLNQGAYHPSFNPNGTAGFESVDELCVSWFEGTAPEVTGSEDCFVKVSTTYSPSGSLSRPDLGKRPDGRFYDAIYASGQGGVCRDMRYSAWGLKQEDFAEADKAIKSGTYRGIEELRSFKPVETLGSSYYYNSTNNLVVIYGLNISSSRGIHLGDIVWVKPQGAMKFYPLKIVELFSTYIRGRLLEGSSNPVSDGVAGSTQLPSEYWAQQSIESSVSDEFTHTEVIGDPANILQCDDLKDGWVGSWNPVIPDGTVKSFKSSKPPYTALSHLFSNDNGASWLSSGLTFGNVNSSISQNFPVGVIRIISYTAKASLTENSTNYPVRDIGDVFFSERYDIARDLGYSLTGSILTDSTGSGGNSVSYGNLSLNSYTLLENKFYEPRQSPVHVPLNIGNPSNDSPAFKALNYNVEDNQQGFINYAYTELTYDGDWGDDGKIHITDNQSTRTDDNGNTVLYGTARIVEPLGWIKNDK